MSARKSIRSLLGILFVMLIGVAQATSAAAEPPYELFIPVMSRSVAPYFQLEGDMIIYGANAHTRREVYEINLTQNLTRLADRLLFDTQAIEQDPETGYLYYFEWQATGRRFAYWDPATGSDTLVRTYNPAPGIDFERMAFAPDGALYAMDKTDRLFTIDKLNGNITLLGQVTGLVSGPYGATGDIAFSPDGTLYLVTYTNLYTVDLNTRAATLLYANLISGPQTVLWTGLAYCDGSLYASHADQATVRSGIFRIDPNTGQTTRLFDNPIFLNDLSSCPVFSPPPPNQPPIADGQNLSTPEDTPLGITLTASDPDQDPLTFSVLNGPAHGSLSGQAPNLSYTPDPNFFGPDSFTFQATDGTDPSAPATININVTPVNDAPVANGDSYNTSEGVSLNIPAPGVLGNDSDVDGDALTAALVSTTQNGTLNLSANGSFTYTPNAGFTGTDSFTYRASDGSAQSSPVTVSIEVAAVNDAPQAVNDSYTTPEDTPLNVPAPGVLGNDSDGDGDPLTAQLVSGPQHGSLTLNSNGSFSYTPAPNYHGADSFTYRAFDGQDQSAPATVSLTVTPVNDAPQAVGDSYSTDAGTALTIPAPGVLGNDSDIDGDALTAILVSPTANGALTLNSNGSFTYTPNAGFSGVDEFTYQARDGTANSAPATVSIAVSIVNAPPQAVNDSYTTPEDTQLNVPAPGVLSNDNDGDGDPLTAQLVSGPQHGSLTLNPNGSFAYTPAQNYHGADSFTYRASDGQAQSAPATVSLTITPVNDAPVATADSYTTAEDTTLTVPAPGVLGNDSDADGDTLTAVLVSSVQNGSLNLNANGSFNYTPNANFAGTDTFSYRAADGSANSNTVSVTINVTPVNDVPQAVNDSYTTAEDTPLTVPAPGVLGNDSDIDGNPLTALLVTGPQHGSLTLNSNGSFVYTPASNYNGADSFTYRARDGQANSAPATVSLTVTPVNDPPVASADSYTTPQATQLTVNAPGVLGNDSDIDGNPLTAVLVSTTQQGVLSLNPNGSFTYTPNAGFTGTDTFTYRASDGSALSSAVIVSIQVTPAQSNDIIVYGMNSYGFTDIYEINLTRNTSQRVGNSLFGTQAIEQDPETGFVYYLEWQLTADQFAYWNPAAGTNTVVRTYNPAPRVYAKRMAFHPNGTLYMMDAFEDLFIVNKQNGNLTRLGAVRGLPTGPYSGTGDMAFGPDGTLYVASYTGLYTVNLNTRMATTLYTNMLPQGNGVVLWSGLAYCDGMLYGSTVEEVNATSSLYRINPNTGQTVQLFYNDNLLNDLSSCPVNGQSLAGTNAQPASRAASGAEMNAQPSAMAAPDLGRRAAVPEAAASPQAANIGIAILGDSNSDEYRADDNRGGEYRERTLNWMEQLAKYRGLNFGRWGTWGEPRRSGYEFNWARSGDTARTMIQHGQHTGVAEQVRNGQVSQVIIYIGYNDFHLINGGYREIYSGTLTGPALEAKIQGIVDDITLAVDTIQAAGEADILIVNIGDPGLAPATAIDYPDPAGRQRVSDAIARTNEKIQAMADSRGVQVVDLNEYAEGLVSRVDKDGFLDVGGEKINLMVPSDDPHHMQLGERYRHLGTVGNGLLASDLFIAAFNDYYNMDIAPFTDPDILEIAGITPSKDPGPGPTPVPGKDLDESLYLPAVSLNPAR